MPRFYFHLSDGTDFLEDEQGRDLPNVEVARGVAMLEARALIAEHVRDDGLLNLSSFIEVENEHHEMLFTLHFSEAVTIDR